TTRAGMLHVPRVSVRKYVPGGHARGARPDGVPARRGDHQRRARRGGVGSQRARRRASRRVRRPSVGHCAAPGARPRRGCGTRRRISQHQYDVFRRPGEQRGRRTRPPVRSLDTRSVLYRTLELTVSPLLRVLHRPDVTGFENVPRSGPVIIAGNHVSFADEIFTPLAARRQIFYLAKAEYFTGTGIKGAVMRGFFGGIGQVPVDRSAARAAAAAVDVCVQLLAQGRAFGIYPEGTRSPDGRLYKFRTGVARIALRSGAPVVPVGLVGTQRVQRPGTRSWHLARVGVHFGAPMD